jgi:uncharacterized membrane protein YccF (DUF307 family)
MSNGGTMTERAAQPPDGPDPGAEPDDATQAIPAVVPAATAVPAAAWASAGAPPPPPPPPASMVVQRPRAQTSFLLRAIWFVFIGWWLSAVAIAVAYFLFAIIIGIPLAFMIFNQLPWILTLRDRTEQTVTEVRDGVTYVSGRQVEQYDLWIRAIWFIFVGWWLGAIYISIAWFLCVIIVTLPIGLWLFNRIGAVMTLLRY